jgi:hypothetical protein
VLGSDMMSMIGSLTDRAVSSGRLDADSAEVPPPPEADLDTEDSLFASAALRAAFGPGLAVLPSLEALLREVEASASTSLASNLPTHGRATKKAPGSHTKAKARNEVDAPAKRSHDHTERGEKERSASLENNKRRRLDKGIGAAMKSDDATYQKPGSTRSAPHLSSSLESHANMNSNSSTGPATSSTRIEMVGLSDLEALEALLAEQS